MAGQDKVALSSEIGQMPDQKKVRKQNTIKCHMKRDDIPSQHLDVNNSQKTANSKNRDLLNMETILRELYFLESKLRKEQKEIWNLLANRDQTISLQKQEIDKLRRENKKLRARKSSELKTENIESERKTFNTKDYSTIHKSNLGRDVPKHSYNLYDSRDIKKVCHKPPIAEKPKLNPSGYIVTTCSLKPSNSSSKGCNIATTISQLLNEESDHGIVISSGSSEPSSPESTLKQSLPKVHKIRAQENDSSSDERKVKILVMDEHEVTSGYNSDTVSEQEHDYENIDLRNSNKFALAERKSEVLPLQLPNSSTYISKQDKYSSNHHIYSNVEYAENKLKDGSDVIEALNLQIGTVSSSANNPKSKLKTQKLQVDTNKPHKMSSSRNNVPRNRSNINQLIEVEDKHVIMQNFEEFSLDSLDLDSYEQKYLFGKENSPVELTRHSGDGAESKNGRSSNENRTSLTNNSSGGYEKFLEATGLSQKSILTPSRMLCNHRSMLKPRDVKHRNKLRVYFTGLPTLEEGSISQSGSQSRKHDKKYWREPFL